MEGRKDEAFMIDHVGHASSWFWASGRIIVERYVYDLGD